MPFRTYFFKWSNIFSGRWLVSVFFMFSLLISLFVYPIKTRFLLLWPLKIYFWILAIVYHKITVISFLTSIFKVQPNNIFQARTHINSHRSQHSLSGIKKTISYIFGKTGFNIEGKCETRRLQYLKIRNE